MISITPRPLHGTVQAPPSKSYAHRGILAAFLSGEDCKVENLAPSSDICATIDCANQLGAKIKFDQKNCVAQIKKGSLPNTAPLLDCGESGSTLRFFIPIAMALLNEASFTGHGRLMERPLEPYFEIFRKKNIDYRLEKGILNIKGKLPHGTYRIDGTISSQFITGLLFALPLLDGDSIIEIDGTLTSRAYVDITLDVLKTFGIEIQNKNYSSFIIKGNQKYQKTDLTVEGDYSQAAFWLVAGALGCNVRCSGLRADTLQGDRDIVEIIRRTGAKISCSEEGILSASPSADMKGITVDADPIPDLVPILAVLFSFCKGTSRIENASRLRLKESDRLAAITSELKKLGAVITEGEDFLEIRGIQVLSGAKTSSHNDHRIAMALAVAACRCEGKITISGAKKAVSKSYPDFFEKYNSLGGIAE